MVDTYALGAYVERRVGSSPTESTKKIVIEVVRKKKTTIFDQR